MQTSLSASQGRERQLSVAACSIELPKYYMQLQMAVARSLDWPACRQAGPRIDVHLQSGDVSIYRLSLLLNVSAVNVVIVIIAICGMPRKEFSLCERVRIHNMYTKSRKSCSETQCKF